MSAMPLLFPADLAPGDTTLAFAAAGDQQPQVTWAGTATGGEDAASFAAVGGAVVGSALAPEQSSGLYTRPGLRGHRLAGAAGSAGADADGGSAAGRDWTPAFQTTDAAVRDGVLAIDLADPAAGLALRTEVESLPGGSLRARHTLINTGADPFVVDGLEVVFPLDERLTEILDFTGRWGYEHAPQRRPLSDGLWLRENRRGKTGHDSAMVTVVGTPGFDFDRGAVLALHVAWSGNSVHRVERSAATQATLGGGELLLPGEVVLDAGQSYSTPWVHLVAATDGLDGVAASFHRYQRSMPSHPGSPRPVNLNVWEAVYFDHDLPRLLELADLAAGLGVERYVLDDGWFRHRRGDSAGLGDWYVDEDVWPRGLAPLIDRVRANGMRFGLWFEPEMVNPDSDLFRAHPDWVLSARDRLPVLQRNQLVLDLSRPEVGQYLLERIDSVLSEYDISYVKWDHNRDLLEAGSGPRAGGPAVHAHTLGFYALLDELRRRHPQVEWESCASGGGRADLGILERVERIWTSDMTDALSRQSIQRWTGQLVAPEYLGAHVSAPVSHQTGRALPLQFRAATALFGHFGIEWGITTTDEADRAALSEWITLYKEQRDLLHSGRVVRVPSMDPAIWIHGVLSTDRRRALMAHVQLDESVREPVTRLRVPGLDPATRYRARWVGPAPEAGWGGTPVDPAGPVGTAEVTGAVLAEVGLPMPRRRPHSVDLVEITAV